MVSCDYVIMILGRDVVQKLEFIKAFETELKELFSQDKQYLPFQKKLVGILRRLNPDLTKISQTEDETKQLFIETSLWINRHYAENIEYFKASLESETHKHHHAIEAFRKLSVAKTHDMNARLKLHFDMIEEKNQEIERKTKEKIDQAKIILSREQATIQKVQQEARRIYQETTQAIELEKVESLELYLKRYDKSIERLNLEQDALIEKNKLQKEIYAKDSQVATQANDATYLIIKNTYTQLSISVNKKINEVKKKYQSDLESIKKSHESKIKPILQQIEELKLSYEEAQAKSLTSYTEKMTALNVVFDVQKQAYEQKKDRFIHEGHEAITLLNSKLSAYRETTQKEKLTKSREIRDEIKSISDDFDKEKKNRELTLLMNQLDQELNKQIIRTHRDIITKKKETQRKLFELDQKHLREINDWRLTKALYEYEKRQDAAKIDLNFNHNLQASELIKKSEELNYAYEKERLLLRQNANLLPLEHQISIGAFIQERELNLLANDAHVLMAGYKYQEVLLEDEEQKALLLLQLERDNEKLRYDADLKVLNASTQLELEKEKLKRDFVLAEQDLRLELSQTLYHKQEEQAKIERKQSSREIELEQNLFYQENYHALDKIKFDTQREDFTHHYNINKIRYEHQQRENTEKAMRLLSTYKNELEYNQGMTESLFYVLRMFYQTDLTFKKTMIDLYHLPSHPEVFKGYISYVIKQSKEMVKSLFSIIEDYQGKDQAFYIKKIEDLTGYKYMLKHENTMNYFDAEILKIEQKVTLIKKDIKAAEDQFLMTQSDIERQELIIEQLKILIEDTKQKSRSDQRHQTLKDQHKEISNRELEVKNLKQTIKQLGKTIDDKHNDITPLLAHIESLKEQQAAKEHKLDQLKHQEADIFYRYLQKSQRVYERLTFDIKEAHEKLILFYELLLDEVYVSDQTLKEKTKSIDLSLVLFEKNLMKHYQSLLNVMLSFYQKNQREQEILTDSFRKSTTDLMFSLDVSYRKQIQELKQKEEKATKDYIQNMKNMRDKTKKTMTYERMVYEKSFKTDQELLKEIESKIQINQLRRDNELKLIHENQMATAAQHEHEHQEQMVALQNHYQKSIINIETHMQTQHKYYGSLDESIGTKNNAIVQKYMINHEKSLASLKQKFDHHVSVMTKNIENMHERHKDETKILKRMNHKRESELKNMAEHTKRYERQMKHDQMVILGKELRLLRKTHFSKMKMLHLN